MRCADAGRQGRRRLALTPGCDYPNLWAGVGLSGYPHLEEAYWFAEGVLPILRAKGVLAT